MIRRGGPEAERDRPARPGRHDEALLPAVQGAPGVSCCPFSVALQPGVEVPCISRYEAAPGPMLTWRWSGSQLRTVTARRRPARRRTRLRLRARRRWWQTEVGDGERAGSRRGQRMTPRAEAQRAAGGAHPTGSGSTRSARRRAADRRPVGLPVDGQRRALAARQAELACWSGVTARSRPGRAPTAATAGPGAWPADRVADDGAWRTRGKDTSIRSVVSGAGNLTRPPARCSPAGCRAGW